MGTPKRAWAVPAIHGDAERLFTLHDMIGQRFVPGDRLVYLGNYIGLHGHAVQTIDELLNFRRDLLALRGMKPDDIIYLRGTQEEMWQKLLQLQFAPAPDDVLEWMLDVGVGATLESYGGNLREGMGAARHGVVGLTRWTNKLRLAVRAHPGHEKFYTVLRRAAYTSRNENDLLFVHSGLDPNRPLGAQGDSFWWAAPAFDQISEPYGRFGTIVRGYDPSHGGMHVTPHTITLDNGCGFEGPLTCACIGPDGSIIETVEA